MSQQSVAGPVVVDFFVHGYRISGRLITRGKAVGDLLNDQLRSYLELRDVYISRINSPAEIAATYSHAQLHKDSLLFAIVPGKERLAQVGRTVSYFGRHRRHVWMALPTFEIEGELQIAGMSFDPGAFLATGKSDYIPILDGTAQTTIWPDITFSGDLFLVNKKDIDLFCLREE